MRSMPARLLTADELLRLPRGRHRHELVRGALQTMSPAGQDHGWIALRFGRLLGAHVDTYRLGRAYGAETGFLLARGPDTVLAPDVAFVRRERLPSAPRRGYFHGAPDFTVEVRSPDDSRRQLAAKARAWLQHGCKLVVTVDPEARTAIIHRPHAEPEEIVANGTISGGDVVPGFELRLEDLFAE
jgi:Uma2 family endonuclease